jgi:selenocysteine lyase/cysteine desulfurase
MISSPFRLDYPSLRQSVYLNQASLGLIGQPAITAMHTFIDKVARHGNLYMSDRDEVAYCETLRGRASRLLHSDSTEVAIVASASEILGQLPMLLQPRLKSTILAVSSDFPAITRPCILRKFKKNRFIKRFLHNETVPGSCFEHAQGRHKQETESPETNVLLQWLLA